MYRLGRGTLLLLLALVVPFSVRAQEHAAPPQVTALTGVYTYDDGASDDLGKAIADATRGILFFVRPFARLKLESLNAPYKRIELRATQDTFTVQPQGEPALQSPLDGAFVKWTPRKGGPIDVRTTWEDGGVRQLLVGKTGKRVNRFWLSGDSKTLTVDVEETSPRLPRPLRYQLVYRRAG